MISSEEIFAELQQYNRICPLPQKWQKLYDLLPNKTRTGSGWDPALPLILAAWDETTTFMKHERLREHLAWADAHHALGEVYEYLRSLKEEDWLHTNE